MKNRFFILLLTAGAVLSCTGLLDERSDSSLTTPVTLEDNQALLDRNFYADTNLRECGNINHRYICKRGRL